ncbi:hypothetical protein HNP84_009803 [Thermocatellispora tengchongensis]|uniref:TIGR01777 family protein n=1 Tax=Thermocatellispora tengchongensis TaxID=1073253 RepID=A0A840PKI7_9ACTN|nr:TIGR01777 family oxidoreductase [Thermocatellispora tengchongensis]MBB5140038.1 hypothetical protein [Thermocatellispora tengchongensis]
MTVVVSGGSGFLGAALVRALRADGERVVVLVRRAPQGEDEAFWDPAGGVLNPLVFDGVRAVVHLAGAGIGDRRWTAAYKAEILRSRVLGTRLMASTLAGLDEAQRPEALLSASGIHYYGDTGDRVVDESGPKGEGFLPDLVQRWEGEARRAAEAGIRVALLRTALVLGLEGGSLPRFLPIFRVGLGAPLGSGRQWWSWISLDDWVGAVRHILKNEEISGPINLTSPEPVTNAEFTKALGRALRRPTMPVPVPGFGLRATLGGFAQEGVLSGPRAVPRRLLESGYVFRHKALDAALSAVL